MTLTKRTGKNLDGSCIWMLRAILNKSWKQHPKKQQLCGHLPLIFKIIQIKQTRHAGICCRSKDELISDIIRGTSSHRCASVGWPTRTYLQKLCTDTGCSLEDLPEAKNDRDEWQERERERDRQTDRETETGRVWEIRASSATWRWRWCVRKWSCI